MLRSKLGFAAKTESDAGGVQCAVCNVAIVARNAMLYLGRDDIRSTVAPNSRMVTIACTTRAECMPLALLPLLAASAMT